MKVLVAGCGSIGERHIKNLKTLGIPEILGHDIREERLKELELRYGIKGYSKIDDALSDRPDAVLVCTPPSLHMPIAKKAVEENCHIFIEKPISNTTEGVEDLINEAEKKKLILMVGYNWRFYPSFKLIKDLLDKNSIGKLISFRAEFGQYLPDWHPSEDYRKGYTARKSLGGGIILDGIHELDYAQWFMGDVREVFGFSDKTSNLEIDVEDTAEILLRFENGAIGEVHLDMVARSYSRNCEIIGDEGTIRWDFTDKSVRVYSATDKRWDRYPMESNYDPNNMYLEEMKHFLDCIKFGRKPISDGINGLKTLKIALAAKESAEKGTLIKM
jgi:predicted dehydrogenase